MFIIGDITIGDGLIQIDTYSSPQLGYWATMAGIENRLNVWNNWCFRPIHMIAASHYALLQLALEHFQFFQLPRISNAFKYTRQLLLCFESKYPQYSETMSPSARKRFRRQLNCTHRERLQYGFLANIQRMGCTAIKNVCVCSTRLHFVASDRCTVSQTGAHATRTHPREWTEKTEQNSILFASLHHIFFSSLRSLCSCTGWMCACDVSKAISIIFAAPVWKSPVPHLPHSTAEPFLRVWTRK